MSGLNLCFMVVGVLLFLSKLKIKLDGVSLLRVPGKVFCKILIKKMYYILVDLEKVYDKVK